MKEVCEKLQASGITPFAATYKETWTLNHLFSCLQGAAVGDYESWVADMNAGKGSFRNDNSSLEFEFMDMMKENYQDKDALSYKYLAYHQEVISTVSDYMTAKKLVFEQEENHE